MHSKPFEATDAESVARRVPLRLSPVLHEVPVAGVAAGSSRFYKAIMSQRVIEVVVGVDGNVAADDLACQTHLRAVSTLAEVVGTGEDPGAV
jgi:hypothetical protein